MLHTSFGVVIWELMTLQVPWRNAAGTFGNGTPVSESSDGDEAYEDTASDPSVYRDPFFHVLREVPRGARLPLPQVNADRPLEELPRVSAVWAQPLQHCCVTSFCRTCLLVFMRRHELLQIMDTAASFGICNTPCPG